MHYIDYDRIRHLNFMGYGHFNHGFGYNTHADYDTNAPSMQHFLGKTTAYLHYLDHIFSEIIEIIADILIRLEEIDKDIDELKKYKHVPSKLDKTDNKHDYITVKNENRTQADGLSEQLTDTLQQHHLMDTSKLDSIIENLVNNVGLETQITGQHAPDDGTCITLGDISKYDELRTYWSAIPISIPRSINYMTKQIGGLTSFVFANITDDPPRKAEVSGQIGQVLATLTGSQADARFCFDNSQWYRFTNDVGTGGNNSYNNNNTVQPGGAFRFSTSWFPDNPSYGNGWINVLKMTGVKYGADAVEATLEGIILRLQKENFVTFADYYNMLNYSIGSNLKSRIDLLEYLELFKEDLENILFTIPTEDGGLRARTRYDELIEYRAKLKEAISYV